MPTKKPQLKTYVDEKIAKKFAYIANEDCRTVSKQLEYLILREIKKFESEKGEIPIEWGDKEKIYAIKITKIRS